MIPSGSGKTLKTIVKMTSSSSPYPIPNGVVIDIIGIGLSNSFSINAEDGVVSDPILADLSTPETFLFNVELSNPNRPKITCVSGTINILVYQ